MLSLGNIDVIMNRLHLLDFNASNVEMDQSGDFISVFDPDAQFGVVRRAIQSNTVFRKKIINMGQLFVDIEDTIWIDGNKVLVAVTFEQGIGAFGTKVKMMVKHLDVVVEGQMKSFLSFEAYNSYLKISSDRR